MVKSHAEARLLLSPGLKEAPVLDRMCSQFVLSLTMRNAGRFNLRRDWTSLMSLAGRHLVWPGTVLARLRQFLAMRCRSNEQWRGHEALADEAFMARHGAWRGPYEEGTLFFYLDEYVKDAPKDLLAVLGATADWLGQSLKKPNIAYLYLQSDDAAKLKAYLTAKETKKAMKDAGVRGAPPAPVLFKESEMVVYKQQP